MNTKLCPTCNAEIPANAPGKLCPKCVLCGADEIYSSNHSAPSLETITAAFPDLEVISFIGQGGMGSVYQVRQPELERTAALKILSPELSSDPAFAERFAREARVMGKLKHVNIATIFESGEQDGYFYLLMEYIDGVNLRQAMQAGRFTPEEALAVVPGICDALQAAHAEGVWHRDIKPENILLDKNGGIKIVDFGIARLIGDPQKNFTLTMTGQALGSTAYMAPEQHEKPHEVDHRADIYSLGVVIYELLTGELPLGRFPSPGERSEVNARIDEIVLKTLAKERELRQQSASEVKTDLLGAAVKRENASESKETTESVSFFDKPDKFFITSLGLWLGGWAGVGIGLFTSPLLFGLGALAAFFGLIGCGWILWRIKKGAHPVKHRSLLLLLAFWPCVFAFCLLPMRLWITNIDDNKYNQALLPSELAGFSPVLYAIAAIIIPLITARLFWALFVSRETDDTTRKWPVAVALLLVTGVLPLEHYMRERLRVVDSSYYAEIRFLHQGTWAKEGHYFESALAEMLVAADNSFKVDMIIPQDMNTAAGFKPEGSGGVLLEWRSPSWKDAKTVERQCVNNLKASLHDRFSVKRIESGDFNDRKRKKLLKGSGGMNVEFSTHIIQPLIIMKLLALMIPFVIVFLVSSGVWSGVISSCFTALVMAGVLGKVNWPGESPTDPPFSLAAKDVNTIPEPEYKYATTRDAITSHIKAAKQEDRAVFEAHVSTRLIDLISKYEGDLPSVMEDWKSLSYSNQIDGDESGMRVKLKGKRKGELFEAYLVKHNEDWQIDSLVPIQLNQQPEDFVQQAKAVAKSEDDLRFINCSSEESFERFEKMEHSTIEDRKMGMTFFSDLTLKNSKKDGENYWLNFSHPNFPENIFSFKIVKERGAWKFSGKRKGFPGQEIWDAAQKLIESVVDGDEKTFRESLSQKFLDHKIDVSSMMKDLVPYRLASYTTSEDGYAKVVLKSENGKEKGLNMVKEEGEWKLVTDHQLFEKSPIVVNRFVNEFLAVAREGDEARFRSFLSQKSLEEITDFQATMKQFSNVELVECRPSGDNYEAVMKPINGEGVDTFVLVQEKGQWKFSSIGH